MTDNPMWTPGPWSTRMSRDGSGDVGITANGVANVVAECFSAIRSYNENAKAEALANANLVSAAPDLYDALANLIFITDRPCSHPVGAPGSNARLEWDTRRAAYESACAALAKARAPHPIAQADQYEEKK